MVINVIIFIIVGVISYKICDKSFLEKETTKSIKDSTKIIFRLSFILSNLILAFIILYIILPVYNIDIILWKLFLTFFSFYFFYFLPFYLIYNLYDYTNKIGLYQIICIYILYLISSNIIYRFFNHSYEKSIFKFNFYFNPSNLLEYLAFILDIFNGISCAYNAVNNVSSLLIYPLLKKRKLVYKTEPNIKKNLDEINDRIYAEENRLNELKKEHEELLRDSEKNNNKIDNTENSFLRRAKTVSETSSNVKLKLHELKNIQISYKYQLDVTTKKESRNKEKGIITFIFNLIKIIQGFVFLFSTTFRCFTMDYTYYSNPLDLKEKSSIYDLLKAPYFSFMNFSDGFIIFVEQIYSLIIIFIMFSTNLSVSRDRIMTCISYVFSYIKENKSRYYDVQMIVFSILIFSYYLICGLLIVNSMKYIHFRDRLHKYLFPDFDFENLHWYYDCPYVLAASFFIVQEIVEYSNIVSPKQD